MVANPFVSGESANKRVEEAREKRREQTVERLKGLMQSGYPPGQTPARSSGEEFMALFEKLPGLQAIVDNLLPPEQGGPREGLRQRAQAELRRLRELGEEAHGS